MKVLRKQSHIQKRQTLDSNDGERSLRIILQVANCQSKNLLSHKVDGPACADPLMNCLRELI